MAEPWRAVSNSILLTVLFDADLDDGVATRVAALVITEPFLPTSEEEYADIAAALRSHAILTESLPDSLHSGSPPNTGAGSWYCR